MNLSFKVEGDSLVVPIGRPVYDGGRDILSYLLEVLEGPKTGQVFTARDESFVLTGLSKGHNYSFRVAAVTSAGRGKWSDPTPATLYGEETHPPTHPPWPVGPPLAALTL